MAASWVVIDMAAQRCCAAAGDGSQHTELLKAQPGSVLFHETVALCVEDIGHLHGGTAHSGLCSFRDRFRFAGPETGSFSMGLTPKVYTAVGYGGSTLTMIVGDGGIVLVDSGDAAASAAEARDAFRRITELPVRAIIYTHGHLDHTMGSTAFVDPDPPQIWAHKRFGTELSTLQHAGLTIYRARGARQFGRDLPPQRRINNGIGPASKPSNNRDEVKEPVPPNRWVTERATVQIAGITLELVANPGKTEDQLYVWLSDRKVVFAGDNFYRCMPNLYAIRGTPHRDVLQWATAVDRLLSLQAVSLVGGHTRPVAGKEMVKVALTDYRDTIRLLFDKTIEGINLGLTPDELVQYVQLPARLAEKSYLQPYYGHPQWAVRSIFTGYLGWFDGNPTNLFPLSPRQQAERIAALAVGGGAG